MKPTKTKKSLTEGYKKEAELKKHVKEYLTNQKVKYFMPVPTGFSEGAVDFLCCARGMFLAIETKLPSRKPTRLQIQFLVDIYKAGGCAIVAYDLTEVQLAMHEIENGRQYCSEELEPWIEE